MQITLTVTDRTGAADIRVTLAAIVDWERKTQKRAGDLAAGFSLEDLAYLAWASLKRRTPDLVDFDEWLTDIDSIEVKDSQESHPTGAAATVGN